MNTLQDITEQQNTKEPILRIWRELNSRNQNEEQSNTSFAESETQQDEQQDSN